MTKQRGRWIGPRAGVVLAAGLLAAGCGGTAHRTTSSTTAATSTTLSAPTTATTTPIAGSTTTSATTAPTGPSFASITGTYVAGTADGGSVYLRADGASRFLAPDGSACPTCSTASSPFASIDFSLTSISSTGAGAYTATGVISGTSDVPWAAGFTGSPAAGSAMSLTVASGRRLTLSFLTSNDVLDFTTTAATYTNTPPCTVAAITPAVTAAQSGATVAGVTCAVDREWASASVSIHGIDEVSVLEADLTNWKVVDRPTACNGHHVPPDLYAAACSTS